MFENNRFPNVETLNRHPRLDRESFDALVIGARVAGSAAALRLVQSGARVLIVDRAPVLDDTLSTHALLKPAIRLLSRWGVMDRLMQAGTPLAREVAFHYGSRVLPIPIKPTEDVPGLAAPRRTVLDNILLETAWNAGAQVRLGLGFVDCVKNADGRVTGARLRRVDGTMMDVRAKVVIGADGRTSDVARAVGAQDLRVSKDHTAFYYSYVPGLENRGYRWYFAPGLSAGAVPTNDGAHCVYASCLRSMASITLGASPTAGIARVLRIFDPELADHVETTPPSGRVRRFLGADGHIRQRAGDGWALVGDAACFKDPATAHGLTDACLDAEALAISYSETGGLDWYGTTRTAAVEPIFDITQKIASFEWDLPELEQLHATLNSAVKHEERWIAELDTARDSARSNTAGRDGERSWSDAIPCP
ncbi:MAG: NAD(P)/FAD-dependent oxidoreductase [Pseudomonadota bacterium]